MTRQSPALIAVCLALLVAGSAYGQARNATGREYGRKVRTDPIAEHAAKLAQIDSWLRGLVGQFRLWVAETNLEGIADCSGIGTGPGVHCIFSIGLPGQRDRWENAVMLFGIDTEGPGVHLFQLNRDSTAEMGVSRLKGNTITFPVQCPVIQRFPRVSTSVILTVLFCRRETRVHVEPDGRFVRIRQTTYEQVLIRRPGARPPIPSSEIREFQTLQSWTLERVRAPGTSR